MKPSLDEKLKLAGELFGSKPAVAQGGSNAQVSGGSYLAGDGISISDRVISAEVTQAELDEVMGSVPTKVSQLENDSGYMTDVPPEYVTDSELSAKGYATSAQLDKKANDYTILLYNGTKGNPKPVKFATVDYSTCSSENGVAAKIGLVSGHGNGTSYAFLADAFIRVSYQGSISVDNFKWYAADASTYDGAPRQYGDIFWVHDSDNKKVAFYVLMGQYARVYQIPWKRLTYSSGGTVTQHTSTAVYESGDKVWANNDSIAVAGDIPTVPSNVSAFANDVGYLTSIPDEYVKESELATEQWTFTLEDGSTVTKSMYVGQ